MGRLNAVRELKSVLEGTLITFAEENSADTVLRVRFEPGSSHTAVRHATIRPLRHCIYRVVLPCIRSSGDETISRDAVGLD